MLGGPLLWLTPFTMVQSSGGLAPGGVAYVSFGSQVSALDVLNTSLNTASGWAGQGGGSDVTSSHLQEREERGIREREEEIQ